MVCGYENCGNGIWKDGFCETHYWRDRWHPKHGPIALKRYLFECLSEWFDRSFGCPPFMMEMITLIYDGIMSEKGAMNGNALALFLWRGAGKSTVIKGCVSWVVAYELKYFIRYRGNTADGAADEFMDGLLDMMLSESYVRIFGELVQDNRKRSMHHKTQRRNIICRNSIMTRIATKGADQTGRGALSKKKRIDWAIGDDLESLENTKTETSRDNIKKKVIQEDLPACTEHKSFYTYLTTPHPDGMYDLIHVTAKKTGLFKIVEYWIYKQDSRGSWLLDDGGQKIPQWPEKLPLEACLAKEALICSDPKLGVPIWNSEYLGILTSDAERPIPVECIQYREYSYFRDMGQNWVRITSQNGMALPVEKVQPSFVVLAVDPAVSEKGTACDSAGCVIDILKGFEVMYRDHFAGKYRQMDIRYDHTQVNGHPVNNPYEIELNSGNIKSEGIVGKIFRTIIHHTPDLVVIEDVSGYKTIYQMVEDIRRHWFLSAYPNQYFELMEYMPEINSESKLNRISRALRGDFERMAAYIRGRVVGDVRPQDNLIHQLTNLGNTKMKDIADAASVGRIFARLPVDRTYVNAVKKYNYPKEPMKPKTIRSFFMETINGYDS